MQKKRPDGRWREWKGAGKNAGDEATEYMFLKILIWPFL
jgi:hypothetical protein